jgi:methyltransferase-like protein
MGSFVAKKLESIKDIVRAEQYLDFIKNRRFRCTLLCHNNVRINRSLSDDTVKDFAFSLDLTAEKSLTEVDLESKKPLKFYYQGYKDASITITSPLLKGIFYTFIENKGYPLKFSTVVNKTNEKYKSNKKDEIELELRNNAMNFVMSSYMKISLFEREYANLEKPSLTELAAYQLNNTNNKWLTSVHHYPVRVGVFDKFALKYMNGKNTRNDILGHLLEDTKTGKLILQKADKNLKDISQIKEELAINLDYTIENFSKQGVLK